MVRLKRNIKITVPIFSLLFITLLSAIGADASESAREHPDGTIGSFSVYISGQYLSVSSTKGLVTHDQQRANLDLAFPVNTRIAITGGYGIEPDDTLFHHASLGLTVYTNPNDSGISAVNPDGPIGAPVISIGAASKIRDDNTSDTRYEFSAKLLVPSSPHLTVGAGINHYDKSDPLIIDEFFGTVAWFFKRYDPDLPYINPDGLPGYPVFRLTGGGNADGLFGQLDVVVPMSPRYSLTVWARGEKISDFGIKKVGVGAGINIYPGNN